MGRPLPGSEASGDSRPADFAIIIGAMKSGTTSLFHVLSQHPEIAAASLKEPGFFSDEVRWSRGWDWYTSLWKWDSRQHRVAMEASPAYTTFPARAGVPTRMRTVAGVRFRFIYIMRHPIGQIASNVRHTLYVGWGKSLDEGIPTWMINTVQYAMQIDEYMKVFPRDSLLLLTLEEFQEEPEAVLRRICAFLGVSTSFEFRGVRQHYNSGDAFEIPRWLAHTLKGAPAQWLAARMPRDWRYRIRAALPRLFRRKRSLGRYQVSAEEERAILEKLRDDLRRLEIEYDVDISRFWSIRLDSPPGEPTSVRQR